VRKRRAPHVTQATLSGMPRTQVVNLAGTTLRGHFANVAPGAGRESIGAATVRKRRAPRVAQATLSGRPRTQVAQLNLAMFVVVLPLGQQLLTLFDVA
jgi:hypothetical protein